MDKTHANLVIEGKVIDIQPSTLPKSRKNWVVALQVDRVVSGEFDGKLFSFRIHSPSRSGLAIGQDISLEAKWMDSGYFVDEMQWLSN